MKKIQMVELGWQQMSVCWLAANWAVYGSAQCHCTSSRLHRNTYVRPVSVTHAPEKGAMNRLHFSAGADFWYVCSRPTNLGPDSSSTRFRRRLEHCSIPSQKPENGVHVTEIKTCDWSMIRLLRSYCIICILYAVLLFIYLFIYLLIFSAVFIFGARNFHPRRTWNEKNRCQKMESIYDAGFWSVCHEPYIPHVRTPACRTVSVDSTLSASMHWVLWLTWIL